MARALIATIVGVAALAGCDEPNEPIGPNVGRPERAPPEAAAALDAAGTHP